MSPHPAPLVAPTGRRTWYFPIAAAAVIVLAVAVTWQVEREQVDDGATLSQSAPAPARKEEKASEEEPRKQAEAQRPAPLAKRTERPAGKPAAPEPFARDPRAAAPAAQAPKPEAEAKNQSSAESAAETLPQRQMQRDEAQPAARAKAAEEPPEKWLERIAQLREQGRHEEADKALAEFRKRYPDYRIPDAMLEKVEKK